MWQGNPSTSQCLLATLELRKLQAYESTAGHAGRFLSLYDCQIARSILLRQASRKLPEEMGCTHEYLEGALHKG